MKDTLTVELRLNEDQATLKKRVAKKFGVSEKNLKFTILKKAIDARNKNDIKFVYNVTLLERKFPVAKKVSTDERVIVVGAGPAGLFCALKLAESGVKPIVFERGQSVRDRKKSVDNFFGGGTLNEESNVQFGEGGAGAFSDGKLNTQVNNEIIGEVLHDFVRFGAPEEIEYLSKPHVGSDKLPAVVEGIRENVISLGGEFRFNERVDDLIIENGAIKGVVAGGKKFFAERVVLAIGHSARDTFRMLMRRGVKMESKDFAVGFRIEQRQELVNKDRYGRFFDEKKLGAADYKLVSHASERAVFTFCMCPGGQVVAASSEKDMLCVNGMSNYAREKENANSAVVCQVYKTDFDGVDPLGGVEFQRRMERLAYISGGGEYAAPVQLAEDFVKGTQSACFKGVSPSYPRETKFADLSEIYPEPITAAIRRGLSDMDGRIRGFASQGAVLSGVETRTSSPIRVLRGENFESVNVKNLYPCGEGCGYAGGISSAAADGVKIARAIVDRIAAETT